MAIDIRKIRLQSLMGASGMDDGSMDMSDYGVPAGPPPTFAQQPAEAIPQENDPRMPQQASSGVAGMGAPKDNGVQDMIDAINRVYTPDTTSRDRLNRLLDTMPERQDPGWARKLVASGLSLKAQDPIKTAEEVMYAPYNRDMAAFKEKAAPFTQAAQLENTANINERTLAGNVVNAQTQQARIASQEKIAEEKNAIAKTRAEAYDFKQRHPDWKFDFSGPNIIAISPDGSSRLTLGPTGHASDIDKENLKGQWAVKAAEARGEAAVKTTQAGAVATGRDLITVDGITYKRNADGSYDPVSGLPKGAPTRPGTPSGAAAKPESPKDTKERQQIAWREIYDNDPTASKWMRDVNGVLSLKPAPTMGSWLQSDASDKKDIAEYEAIRQKLYPNVKGIGPTTAPSESPKPSTGLAPTTPPQGGQVPSGSPFTTTQIQAMPPDEKRQRAIGYLIQKGLDTNERNIQIAIQAGRFAR